MPKVHHVKKAQRAVPHAGIEVGDSYYWWGTRSPGRATGIKHFSKTYPTQSQLTSSPFWKEVYAIQESMTGPVLFADDLDAILDDAKGQIEALRDEEQGKLDNMPESLKYSPTGELIQSRIDALDEWIGEIEAVEIPDHEDYPEDENGEDGYGEALEEVLSELAGYSLSCD